MLREKRGGKMRRRCFFILILVLTLLAFIDALGIPLKPAQLPPGESEAITCTGKILRIQSKDGRTDMQIKLLTYGDKKVDFSENVLVSVYENLNACSLSRSTSGRSASMKKRWRVWKPSGAVSKCRNWLWMVKTDTSSTNVTILCNNRKPRPNTILERNRKRPFTMSIGL